MYEFCLLGCGIQVPAGPDWYHEIKYDGFRLLCSERRHGLQASGSTRQQHIDPSRMSGVA